MKDEKNTAPGAENTESGKLNESKFSLPLITKKVKSTMPFDLYTEIFMLDMVAESLNSHYVEGSIISIILSELIRKCVEVNEV